MAIVNRDCDLVTNRNGVVYPWICEDFRTTRANDFSARMSTGKLTHSDMDQWPTEELVDFSHGLGVEFYRDDLAVFADSDGLETAVQGQVTLLARWRVSDAGKVANCFKDAGDYTFAGGTTSIRYFNPATETWDNAITGLAAPCVDLEFFGGKLYAALGDLDTIKVCADPRAQPKVWVDDPGTHKAHCLKQWNGKLWYGFAAEVYNYDGTTWGTAVKLGDSDPKDPVQCLEVQDGLLVAKKMDGMYASLSDGSKFLPFMVSLPRCANGTRALVSHVDGNLYFPNLSDVYRVSAVTGTPTLSRVTPARVGDTLFGWGQPIAFSRSSKYVYALFVHVGNEENSVILKYNGDGWHKQWKSDEGKLATAVYFSPVSARLFVCDGTDTLAQRMNTLNDSSYPDYDTDNPGALYFAHHDAVLADIDKAYRHIRVISEQLAPGVEAAFSYIADRSTAPPPSMGNAITSPQAEVTFDEENMAVQAKDMQLIMELSTNDAAVSPKIKGLYLSYMPRPATIYAITATLLVEDHLVLRDGTVAVNPATHLPVTADERLAELRILSDTVTPWLLDTPDNLQHRVIQTNIGWQDVGIEEKQQ
ncbi:MAG: hypothetical protein M1482_07475 [Chloroflexi bacterium]|nr:hypothetical protein [Chloroflexota bacterium]